MHNYLDFEKPIAELEGKIAELRHLEGGGEVSIADEVGKLQAKAEKLLVQTYAKLDPWQRAQVARHPNRPHALQYVEKLIENFTPLSGDRAFGEDAAVIGGLGRFRGRSVVVIGTEKGADTESRLKRNFGMARPEGYRKAQRLMRMAERFGLPVISFIDTSGAFPGSDAEARGQAEAIARSIQTGLTLEAPFVAVIIGEGGSGGAIALATADSVLMLEHSIYSVISPEGCASILWRDSAEAPEAAAALRLTAEDLMEHGVIDTVVPEPLGGAQRDPEAAVAAAGGAIAAALEGLEGKTGGELRAARREKFLAMGRAPVKELKKAD